MGWLLESVFPAIRKMIHISNVWALVVGNATMKPLGKRESSIIVRQNSLLKESIKRCPATVVIQINVSKKHPCSVSPAINQTIFTGDVLEGNVRLVTGQLDGENFNLTITGILNFRLSKVIPKYDVKPAIKLLEREKP